MKKNFFNIRVTDRGTIGAIFCVCIMLASIATAINLTTTNEDIESLSYTYLFKAPNLQLTLTNNQEYVLLESDGCFAIGKNAGEPMVPVKPVSLLLPPMKEVAEINVIGTPIEVDMASKPVFPYQNPVPFGSEPGEFVTESSVYSVDAFYPGALQENYQIGYSHGYTILSLNLNPVQYNPVKGKINYYPEMTINIELKDTNEMNQFYRNNYNDKDWVEKLVDNPDITNTYTSDIPTFDYPGGICDPSDNYDYVIITTEYNDLDYWSTSGNIPYNWESLMDKHEAEDGLSCTLVTIQDIDGCNDYQNTPPFNDMQAQIREFCKDAYEDWGTEYVLIGGDDEWIAARHMDTNYEGNIDSDIYWSNLDNNFNYDEDGYWGEEGDNGFDLYAEIFIGRLTCDEPQDISNWMTKSFYYADSLEEDYLEGAAFYGGNTGWNCQGDDFMDYSAIKGTDDWLGPIPGADGPFPSWAGFQFGFETWNSENPDNQYDLSVAWTAEPPNPGWQGGSESAAISGFKTAINNDQVVLASGIAHANADMSLDVGSSSWESNYHNTKPFFLHDYGCHCGDMDAAADGVLHSMLFHSDTELAFAVVYNTCYGWGNFDTTNSSSAFQAKEFWSYFLDTENKSGDFLNWQFGKGHAYSKDRMAPTINWDYSSGTWRAIIQGCLLFGDPAQMMKSPHPSESPYDPDAPEGPAEWIPDIECTFTAKTDDPDGDQIFYQMNWGGGETSEWLGPYPPNTQVSIERQFLELGTYEVSVRARDIWGSVSGWSPSHTIEIIENSPPELPTFTGPSTIRAQKLTEFSISANDPEGHDLYYYVNWGDGAYTEWLGPYSSGEVVIVSHAWSEAGNYIIKSFAKDFIGDKSPQANFDLLAWKSMAINNQVILRILERIIDNFPLIKQILQI